MAPYTSTTTAEEITSDLSSAIKGKTILITGVSPGGLGAEFAHAVARHSPSLLILAGRDAAKIESTAKSIAEIAPSVATRTLKLDLSSQTQVREAAKEVNNYTDFAAAHIDVLVNNAGIMAVPYAQTPEGIESQFGSNHIGHFLFTNLIMNKLIPENRGRTARVVNVASDGHRLGPVRFGDWNFDNGKTYHPWRAYGQSKSANLLFTRSLASKLAHKGLISVSLHPGVIITNLGSHLNEQQFWDLAQLDRELGNVKHWNSFNFITLSQGVSTHVFASFHDSITAKKNNGAYLQECRVFRPEEIPSWGRDEIEAEKLWKLSEKLVGEEFSY